MGQGTLAYGSMIEVLQSFTPDHMAEWANLLADALGLAVGFWGWFCSGFGSGLFNEDKG
eukprot:gene13295-17927_t